jgi:hypothetical protein
VQRSSSTAGGGGPLRLQQLPHRAALLAHRDHVRRQLQHGLNGWTPAGVDGQTGGDDVAQLLRPARAQRLFSAGGRVHQLLVAARSNRLEQRHQVHALQRLERGLQRA